MPTGKLLIAVPALNEESAIEGVIQRVLAAREPIVAGSTVTDVEVTVVSDGSTDRTVELASRYLDDINLIIFESNRGYGAAIKEAWSQSDAETLGFLDADGTCDPEFFVQLCTALERERADLAVGDRLTPESRMPTIRRLGNNLFGFLLMVFSSGPVGDSASGMRVVRRSSLPKLFPLPDGLHFTPAMSARAVLNPDLKIVEIPMAYYERQGESKLKIVKDGLRFLKVIVQEALLYRPARPLGILGVLCLAATSAMMITPTLYYLEHRAVEEWMIYRFVVSNLAGTTGASLICAGYLSAKVVDLALANPVPSAAQRLLRTFFSGPIVWIVSLALLLAGGLLVLPSFVELLSSGATTEHWTRFIAMSFLVSISLFLAITRLFDYVLDLLADRLGYLESLSGHGRKDR